jgi:DNA-binding transcriptional ArsR family regulator
MSGSTKETEETYSTMFSSLRHPARRKILKMLSERSMTFSQMLEELEIPGSHLTYHLENLGELIVKMEDGKYKLSSVGEACCSIMKSAEEVPNIQTKQFLLLPLRWKTLFTVFIIAIVLLASMSCIQYASFNQLSTDYGLLKDELERVKSWSTSATNGIDIIKDIFQINIAKYQLTLLSHTVEDRSDLDGAVEEILKYSLTTSESKIDLVLRFRNNHFSLYQLTLIEGVLPFDPSYIQPQSTNILEATRSLIERYKSISSDPYLEEISTLLASANETNNEQTLGNTKLKKTVYGDNAEVLLMYTANGYDNPTKRLRLIFHKNVLQELSDDWFLYTVSDAQVNISKELAIQIARNAAKNFQWNADGVTVSNFNVLAEPVSAVFFPHPRTESLVLVPYWFITLYLDKEYAGGVNSITVGVWADNGEVANIQALSSQVGT